METIVIYYTETGFTKRYAESIERRIPGSKLIFIKNLKKKDLKDSKFIFFGGPLRNNKILGLNKFLKYYKLIENKNIFVFATGIEPLTDSKRENVIYANGLEYYHVRLYLFPGGLDLSKMKPLKRKILTYGMKVAAKQNPTVAANTSLFERQIDLTNTNYLDDMLNKYHIIKLKGWLWI